VINSKLEEQKYLFVLSSVNNKINIPKIRANSYERHGEIGHWTIPKTSWVERIFHLCDVKNIENEKYFFLECLVYGYPY